MGLAIGLQFAAACFFVYGLKDTVTKYVPTPFFVDPIKQDEQRTPPPPLPPETRVKDVTVILPPIDYRQGGDPGPTFAPSDPMPLPPQPPAQPMPVAVERAAVGIAGTHTTPPYPPVARRQGLEGVVTLRLTVGTDGRVSAAEIVTSAGSAELDQVARDWILGHWRYRPALKDGNPAPAQLLASVTYSLKNQ